MSRNCLNCFLNSGVISTFASRINSSAIANFPFRKKCIATCLSIIPGRLSKGLSSWLIVFKSILNTYYVPDYSTIFGLFFQYKHQHNLSK
ncbi:hypothetical protein AX774_g2102 [Zancudomyces culisetae]|uniref:Uncharacterized protein n=1 Tax=Zancudomyces culisetae TaxID=1213189 RepID=A0A1R1PG85_ZANCU|nr:hypothetical protein AX774_g6630 [Zancudomyces culisetae]OMH84386.1 hypothetical protein AX774_g2102 [Zancudomyces culisetae]|eukprot:OMH79939.1 hypothetical protein AX774_g6630 [Zancudomyces culisetae]